MPCSKAPEAADVPLHEILAEVLAADPAAGGFEVQYQPIVRFAGQATVAVEGNRAIVFHESDEVPVRELEICIAAALTYRRTRNLGSAARKNG